MDSDGLPELIAGNQIYKVNIITPLDFINNSVTPMTGGYKYTGTLPTGIIADGWTHVADFDLDGKLEV
ncbi:MAG: hypothetical protein LBR86_00090, partial [Tannerella sp.]|nr:hypothetical protein [Tannerella sp.]